MIVLDEILGLSHTFRQGDEMKHLSGMSQSQGADEQFVRLQYPKTELEFAIIYLPQTKA